MVLLYQIFSTRISNVSSYRCLGFYEGKMCCRTIFGVHSLICKVTSRACGHRVGSHTCALMELAGAYAIVWGSSSTSNHLKPSLKLGDDDDHVYK